MLQTEKRKKGFCKESKKKKRLKEKGAMQIAQGA